MLPILVLALAASALAAPGVQNIRQISSNEVGPLDNSPVSYLFDLIDGGDKFLSEINIGEILKDLSRSGNQAQANGQALAGFAEIVTGIPGDSCHSAAYVNAYANYARGGSSSAVRQALSNYFNALFTKIDNIVNLIGNKDAAKYASGVRGGCPNGGRTYQFEDAWEIILGGANSNLGLVQEEYCALKRMYCSLAIRPNNVGSAVTAAALPPSSQVWEAASGPLANFIRAAGSKSNLGGAAANLKQALRYAVGRVQL